MNAGDTDTVEQEKLQKKKTFPEQLKYQRELRGWSQAKMAEEIGATPNRISSWERGVALPGAYFREQLCIRLDMNAQELGLLPSDSDNEEDISSAQEIEAPAHQALTQSAATHDTAHPAQGPLHGRSTPPPYHFLKRKRILRAPALLALVSVLLVVLLGAAWYGFSNGIFDPAQANPYLSNGGQLVLNDALHSQNSDSNWQEGTNDQQASCVFSDKGYAAFQPLPGYFHACIAQKTDYTNFTYEVAMTIEQGEFGGIVFRSENSIDGHYYIFRIHTDGSYWLYRFVDRNIVHAVLLQHSSTRTFNKGLGKKNMIAVVAQGSSLTLYINRQQVCALQDAGYTHGQVGVFAGSFYLAPSKAVFENAKVWTS